jgi:hypothetical protein
VDSYVTLFLVVRSSFLVLLSSLKKKRLGVGAVENCLQFSKSLVDAFFASTGTSASTPSLSARKVSVSVEAIENSHGDTRARTWVDLEVGRDPDRRSWGILIGCFLASACAIVRVSLIAGSDQTKRLAAHQPPGLTSPIVECSAPPVIERVVILEQLSLLLIAPVESIADRDLACRSYAAGLR